MGFQELFAAGGLNREITTINIRIIHRIPFISERKLSPVIIIVTPPIVTRISTLDEKHCKEMLASILGCPAAFVILSCSSSIPVSFTIQAAKYNTPIAASQFDENYLQSLLKALIREKLQDTICVHGNVLEAKGKGILIKGASGIGKTTAALKAVITDNYWIADDVAVIKKNRKGELIACGDKKICNYVHTQATGIVPVSQLLDPGRIKKQTILSAIIEIKKSSLKKIHIVQRKRHILGKRLTCFSIDIPAGSYFDENLLKKAVTQISEDD